MQGAFPDQFPGRFGAEIFLLQDEAHASQVEAVGVPAGPDGGIFVVLSARVVLTGVDEPVEGFARQHRELIAHVNALMEAVGRSRSREEIAKMMAFLEVYVVRHFRDEERLMEMMGYPQLDAHRALHASFRRTFARLRAEYDREGATPGLAAELNVRVGGWLVSHIGKLDRDFGEYITGVEKSRAHSDGGTS